LELTSRFSEALLLAHALHSDQKRKQTKIPYISHLLGVCAIAIEHGANEDEAIAALLHDAVEDQGGADTEHLIRKRFGDTATDIVLGCTDTDVVPKPPWRERKEQYIAHLDNVDASTLLVSTSDKLYNARAILSDYRDIGDEVWQRFKGGKDGTLWYYQALVTAIQNNSHHLPRLVAELKRVVDELVQLSSNGSSHKEKSDPMEPGSYYSFSVDPNAPFRVDVQDNFNAHDEKGYLALEKYDVLEEAIELAAGITRESYKNSKDFDDWNMFGDNGLVYDTKGLLVWSGSRQLASEMKTYFSEKTDNHE